MEKMELRMSRAEEDIKELKKYHEECLTKNFDNEKRLATTIQKIEDLIMTVENLPKNIESSMIKTMEFQKKLQEKEHEKMYGQILEIKKDKEELEKKVADLKKIVDERTIGKDSKSWDKLIWLIIGGLISFLFSMFKK